MQEQAMTAAILTQVHLAYNDYQTKQGEYATAQADAVPAQAGLASELKAAAAKAKAWLALAELKQSETALVGVLGADVLPQGHAALTQTQLSTRLSQRMEKDYAVALNQWTVYAANQIAVPDAISALPGLQLVAYEPSLPIEIPLAQKLSARSNVGDQGVSRVDPKSFLPVSHWQVKSLLDAPITEP
jgi:hypothetical protein